MLRRLHHEQPESFAFTPANLKWAEAQITKFPEGRQASALIPLLWRAQEQEGWVSRPAIEAIAAMLDLAYIRVLEVATFYFGFHLQPVGSVAHVMVCGTTSCMICGAEDLIGICRELIAVNPHDLSSDGKFSWEEVECIGACSNAPVVQIGKDYYEDLTAESFRAILADLAEGRVPRPGSQNGRFASEPLSGLTSLTDQDTTEAANASVALALEHGDTLRRIDGTEVPLLTPWLNQEERTVEDSSSDAEDRAAEGSSDGRPEAEHSVQGRNDTPAMPEDQAGESAAVEAEADALAAEAEAIADEDTVRPAALEAARDGKADDLKLIKGVGPKLEQLLHSLGFYHFDQIAGWSAAEIAWVDRNLEGFKGRVVRDRWVAQARILAAGGATEFSQRAKT